MRFNSGQYLADNAAEQAKLSKRMSLRDQLINDFAAELTQLFEAACMVVS
jgi:hypothetical protein